MAHAVGENLKHNPEDILKSPASVDIWGRFICGMDDPTSVECQQRTLVLRHIALFLRFGFESPVESEAQFISKMVEDADPNITWQRFQSIVYTLKERRILQGKKTLFIVPKALHIYLWIDFWQHHGRGFSLATFINTFPTGMAAWFSDMLPYAHSSQVATQAVENFLAPGGPFDDDSFAQSNFACQLLSDLCEGARAATLRCIERVTNRWSDETTKSFSDGRQNLVRALEKIAIWKDSFVRAAAVLLRFAANENASYTNNATGTFAGLFSLAYGPVAPTEAAPEERWQALRAALDSEKLGEREVGLLACKTALSIHQGIRFVGSEHQGLRPVALLWQPKLWGEVFDAYQTVWKLVTEKVYSWKDKESEHAAKTIIEAARELIQIRELADMVLATVEQLVSDNRVDLREVIAFITLHLRFHHEEMGDEIKNRLESC